MTQYKFRGKRVDNGQWVYGSLVNNLWVKSELTDKPGQPTCEIIAMPDGYYDSWEHIIENYIFEVIPETVGQFTGLKGYIGGYKERRQNEVELYEGDIVEAKSEGTTSTFEIWWRQAANPSFILFPAYQSNRIWSISASDLGRKPGDYYDELRLLGNIHDNPELIKRTA